jgi:uncharacterized protein
LGLRPALDSVPALLEALYTLAERDQVLAVIDEFPYLLPAAESERDEVLTSVQAVMEERDASQLGLVLCGSYIGQMERLLTGPLRGRFTGLLVEPLDFAQATVYLESEASADDLVERYAVAGGMSLYLDELGRGGTLRQRVVPESLTRGARYSMTRARYWRRSCALPGVYYSLVRGALDR